MTIKTKKLAIVASHPIQYWTPVYRELAQANDIQIKVFYVAQNGETEYFDNEFEKHVKWDRPLTEGYPYQFLRPKFILEKFSFFSVDSRELTAQLEEYAPDGILINGYGQRVAWRALKYAKTTGTELFYISDSNSTQIKAGWKNLIKSIVLRYFFSHVTRFLVTSPRNEAYLLHYRADPKKFYWAPLPTDIKWLKEQCNQITQEQIDKIRENLNIPPDHKILLFVGKLIPRKRPQDAIQMLASLKSDKVSLLLVGSGSMEGELNELSSRLGLQERVIFLGFINQAGLPIHFKLADLLVFPSSDEPYGLVASEVLPFGLPIVAASNIGSVGASIKEGENALLYSCSDVDALSHQISKLLENDDLSSRMSKASQAMAYQFDCSVLANKIVGVLIGKSEA